MDRLPDDQGLGGRWVPWAIAALALALFIASRATFVSMPLERDEGEYAYIAQRWLQGEIPYRDTFDQKPPAVFVVYAAVQLIGGESTQAIHGVLALFTGLTALVLAWSLRRAAGGAAAALGALAYVLASIDPALSATAANTEAFMLLPVVASWAYLRAGRDGVRGAWLACGACLALACWFKPVAATQALVVLALLVVDGWRTASWRPLLARMIQLGLGAAAVSLPMLAPFVFADDAWAPFVDAVFLHNLDYVASLTPGDGLQLLSRRLAKWLPGAAGLVLLAFAAGFLPRERSSGRWLALVWLLASAVGASVGWMFRPHYLLQLVAPLAWLAALGARWLLLAAPARSRSALALGLAALVAGPYLLAHRELILASPEAQSRALYGGNPFPESPLMAAAIAERSAEDSSLLIVGSEPQILFHARRRSATRYIILHPLLGPFADAKRRQAEALEEIRAADPELVLWVDVPTSFAVPHPERSKLLKTIRRLLDDEYELDVLAAPVDQESVFRFWYGAAARRTARRQAAALAAGVHLALYRRRP